MNLNFVGFSVQLLSIVAQAYEDEYWTKKKTCEEILLMKDWLDLWKEGKKTVDDIELPRGVWRKQTQ